MSLRMRRGVGAVALFVVAAAGCGPGDAAAPAVAPAAPMPTVAAPSVPAREPAPPVDAPAEAAPTADPRIAAAPRAAPPILAGDVMWFDDSERRTLLLRIPDRPRPAGRVIAQAQVHQGFLEVRLLAAASSPYATAEIIGYEGTCTARIVRARELHTLRRGYDDDDDPASQYQSTYLGLDLDGCERGSAGVVGAPVTVRSLREVPVDRTEPAPPELVAIVQSHDDDLGYAEPRAPTDFRVLALPERDIRLVLGTGNWVLAQGTRGVGTGSVNGMVDLVIEAGWRTFFFVTTPSDGWVAPLEQIVPEIHRSSCVVTDPSGTPLNVRRLPRSSAEVVATLANDTTIDALVGPSAWARVATTPAGWAHTSGLRCTTLPVEPWP